MALSASESELLTQTCENMNIAANTCREVLEMLRSLGNTGVVDIATHNNAADAHANVASLAHISGNETLLVGPAGYCNSSNTHQNDTPNALRLLGSGGFYAVGSGSKGSLLWSCVSNKTKNNAPGLQTFLLESDSNGDIANSVHNRTISTNRSFYTFLDGSDVKTVRCALNAHWNGLSLSGDPDNGWVSFIMTTSSGTETNTFYFSHTCIAPLSGITASLGRATLPFDTAYLATAATVTSDRREKSGIGALDAKAVDFIKALRPVQFTLKNGRQEILETAEDGTPTNVEVTPGVRHHWGLIAQEVQEALASAGYDPSNCAVWSLADKNDPDSRQALRYEELIAPMIKVIQNQQERIEALERKVA